MTTGWHYFSDVVAGVAVAIISMKVSFLLTQDSRLVCDLDAKLRSVDSSESPSCSSVRVGE